MADTFHLIQSVFRRLYKRRSVHRRGGWGIVRCEPPRPLASTLYVAFHLKQKS